MRYSWWENLLNLICLNLVFQETRENTQVRSFSFLKPRVPLLPVKKRPEKSERVGRVRQQVCRGLEWGRWAANNGPAYRMFPGLTEIRPAGGHGSNGPLRKCTLAMSTWFLGTIFNPLFKYYLLHTSYFNDHSCF